MAVERRASWAHHAHSHVLDWIMRDDLPNVVYDTHSTLPFDGAMESDYVYDVLDALRVRMGDSFESYSFHYFTCGDPSIRPASYDDPHPRKVLIYTAEEDGSCPVELANHHTAVFKGYLPDDRNSMNIFPLALGCVNGVSNGSVKPLGDREIDVFFSGHLNRNRIELYRELSALRYVPEWMLETGVAHPRSRNLIRLVFGSDFSRAFDRAYICFTEHFAGGLSREAYAEKLHKSRIALCPGGFHSVETFRHYEAVRAGCVVISEPLPDNALYRDSPIQQVGSWREGIALAKELLRDETRLAELHEATVDWWNNHWSPDAVARDMHAKLAKIDATVAESVKV